MTQRPTAPRALSERTRLTYAAAWSLFTDWCAVTGHPDLPADPTTVIAFLSDCPAAGKTHRGWADAIDHRRTRRSSGHDRGRRGGGATGVAQSRLDTGHLRPARPLPARTVQTGGGAV